MINFDNIHKESPVSIIHQKYLKALDADQKNIEAIAISSLDTKKKEVDSRYVNLKYVKNDQFIFFTNYNSPKSAQFKMHNQISVLIFWPQINTQIRMKAIISKTNEMFNKEYFKKRDIEKNALSISSNQSSVISSYSEVLNNYKIVKINDDLTKCPTYWGGYSFIPYIIEFWEGNESRINKRYLYEFRNDVWSYSVLEP